MLEQVLDENSPRWITGVKLTRLTMGDKVRDASAPTMGLLDLLLVIHKCDLVKRVHAVGPLAGATVETCEDMPYRHLDLRLHALRTSGPPNAAAGDHLCEGVQGSLWSIGWA